MTRIATWFSATLAVVSALLCLPAPTEAGDVDDLAHGFVYQIVTDRFCDGNRENNDPPISRGMFDGTKTNWHAYWGGDLEGIEQKLDYLSNLGVRAIWISPPVDNFNVVMHGAGGAVEAPYHGYHARDFSKIDEHFGDQSNSWKAFDSLVAAAHQHAIKVIVDFAANHTNPVDGGEYGALFDSGKLIGKFSPDKKKLFHHFGTVSDWSDPFQMQYKQIFDLADLDQGNETVDRILKEAAGRFQEHGVDGFRIDAIKHTTWGWLPSLVSTLEKVRPTPVFGEWFDADFNSPTFSRAAQLVNQTGIPILDFPFSNTVREVLGHNSSNGFLDFVKLMEAENGTTFKHPGDLYTFFDNHDIPRFQNLNANKKALHLALGLLMTSRGTPCLLYGTEQYLYNPQGGGQDPHDRPMMESYDETADAYKLVQKLAKLRAQSDAVAWGETKFLVSSNDVLIFSRQVAGETVVVALNRSAEPDAGSSKGTFDCTFAPGSYSDFLDSLVGGEQLTVNAVDGKSQASYALKPQSFSVWRILPSSGDHANAAPLLAKLLPRVVSRAAELLITGARLGDQPGMVTLTDQQGKKLRPQVIDWRAGGVLVKIPADLTGPASVQLERFDGAVSNHSEVMVVNGIMVPVTFRAKKVKKGEQHSYFILPAQSELAAWGVLEGEEFGPLLRDPDGRAFLTLSVPAGARLNFQIEARDNTKSTDRSVENPHKSAQQNFDAPLQGVGECSVNLPE